MWNQPALNGNQPTGPASQRSWHLHDSSVTSIFFTCLRHLLSSLSFHSLVLFSLFFSFEAYRRVVSCPMDRSCSRLEVDWKDPLRKRHQRPRRILVLRF